MNWAKTSVLAICLSCFASSQEVQAWQPSSNHPESSSQILTAKVVNSQDEINCEISIEKLTLAKSKRDQFYALADASKNSFTAGKYAEAKAFSLKLLALASEFPKDWNYGNAVHDANMVLGRIALKEGDTTEAISFLLKAGGTPGSPNLNSFGPNMNLAKDLLEKGEKDSVLKYFELCGKFWGYHQDYLDKWSLNVKNGQIPDFKANLLY